MTTTPIAPEVTAAAEALTDNGKALMRQVGTHGFSFFDDGINEGSGIWGQVMAEEMTAAKTPRSASGIMGRAAKLGLWHISDTGDAAGAWWTLTALGANVARLLAADTDAAVEEVPAAETEPVDSPAVKPEAKKAAKPEAPATTEPVRLNRKQCLALAAEHGYTGPTSYLVPRLQAIIEDFIATSVR